jgi:hypothetical protein
MYATTTKFSQTGKSNEQFCCTLIDSPLTCKSGRFSDETNRGQIIEENTDCNADLSYICQGTGIQVIIVTTVLPVLFKYCCKYCYSDSRKL